MAETNFLVTSVNTLLCYNDNYSDNNVKAYLSSYLQWPSYIKKVIIKTAISYCIMKL